MIRKLATATGLVLAFLSAASAQPKPHASITLNIPFEFSLGNRILPAGTYKLEELLGAPTEADQVSVLALRNLEDRIYQAVVTDVSEGEAELHSRLVFTYFHGQQFLSEVWVAGQHMGLRIHVPRVDGEAAQERKQSELVELKPLTQHR